MSVPDLLGVGPPIADGPHDQTSATDNPLWEAVRLMPTRAAFDGCTPEIDHHPLQWQTGDYDRDLSRNQLVRRYAWAICTPGDLAWLGQVLEGQGVVEVGAGTGYWAWQLEQTGVDVAAYDPYPPGPDNDYCEGGPYTTILPEGPEAAGHHPDRALLLTWPPYSKEPARHALASYEGDLLIYAGEGLGGCCGDDTFFELLDAEWERVSTAPAHLTWWAIHCELAAYRRVKR